MPKYENPQDYPAPANWMRDAADEIDAKFGLPRNDQAPYWCAQIIARHYLEHVAREQQLAATRADNAPNTPDTPPPPLPVGPCVWQLAVVAFGGDAGARAWLQSPALGLGGRIPAEVTQTEGGMGEVLALLERIENGCQA